MKWKFVQFVFSGDFYFWSFFCSGMIDDKKGAEAEAEAETEKANVPRKLNENEKNWCKK